MKTSSKVYNTLFITAVCLLVVTTGLFVGLYIGSKNKSKSYATQLNNTYERNFFELASGLNEIEVNLSKLVASTSSVSNQKLLLTIWRDASTAQENISNLPVSHETLKDTLTFVNRLGEYCYSLSTKLVAGKDLTSDDVITISELQTLCEQLNYDVSLLALNIANGSYNILENSKLGDDGSNNFSSSLEDLTDATVETPTMIYDGPYSESSSNREIKGLSKTECTAGEANDYLKSIFSEATDITYQGETKGKFETYNFEISLKDGSVVYAQVTKRGKFLLTFTRSAEYGEAVITKQKCIEIASDFAFSLGMQNMQGIFVSMGENVGYVNVAPVVNDVVIYSDIIKIKINLKNGDILGYEATSYAYNHVERTNFTPSITPSEAREKVNSKLTIESTRLAIIPKDYGDEVLAYEFECTLNGFTYYVYINAETGAEEDIFRVVSGT